MPSLPGRLLRYGAIGYLALLSLSTAATHIVLTRIHPVAALIGQYFASTDWSGQPLITRFDADLSTATLSTRRAELGLSAFSVEWQGYVAIDRDGIHRFAVVSDDGARLYVDGELVVDNGSVHGAQLAQGQITRPAGVYPVLLRYFQAGGDLELLWMWADDAEPLTAVPSDTLAARRAPLAAMRLRRILQHFAAALTMLWSMTITGLIVGWPVRRMTRFLREEHASALRALGVVLVLAFVLGIWGIQWGLPGGWAPDELTPAYVIEAIHQQFANGWHTLYPPVQFYLLAPAVAPFLLAGSLGFVSLETGDVALAIPLLMRVVTLLMGLSVVLATYLTGATAFDRRSGVLASLIMALTLPFVYYTKTANTDVPYLFWLAWSFWAYVRLWRSDGAGEYAWFGVTAALAVCTKDQAYGFYALIPLALVVRLATRQQEPRIGRRIAQAAFDRRLWIGGGLAVLVFAVAHNFLFNWNGVLNHFRLIAVLGRAYGMADPTLRGDADLLMRTIGLVRWSFGWPLFVLCMAGLVMTLASGHTRAIALWLLIPSLSYWITFLGLVGYVYDRFLLGVCLAFALFGGWLAATLVSAPGRFRPVRRAVVFAAFAYTALADASLNAMMSVDTRYAAENWLHQHVPPGARVGWFGHALYSPRLDGLRPLWLELLPEGGIPARPEFLVINTDVLARSGGERLLANLRTRGFGYTEAWRLRSSLPRWAVLRYEPLIANGLDDGTTSLDNVNPEIVIFRRDGGS